ADILSHVDVKLTMSVNMMASTRSSVPAPTRPSLTSFITKCGHVASERAQTVEHRVERSRQAVELAKMAAGQRHHVIEIKIADRGGALGRTADRACNGAGHDRRDD